MAPETHYMALGVARTSSTEQIRKAYYALCKLYHPDRHPHKSPEERKHGENITKAATLAWSVLQDDKARFEYDKKLAPEEPFSFGVSTSDAGKPAESEFFSYAASGKFSHEKMNGKARPKSQNDGEGSTYRRAEPGDEYDSEDNDDASKPVPEASSKKKPSGKRARVDDTDSEASDTEESTPPPAKRLRGSSPDFKRDKIEIRGNSLEICLQGWEFSIQVSKKYDVGDIHDITPKGRHGTTISVDIALERNNDWEPSQKATKQADVRVTVNGTPKGRDVARVSSLLKYQVRLRPNSRHLSFVLTLTSPRKAKRLSKFPPWSLCFEMSTAVQVPQSSLYAATHVLFSKTEPENEHRDGRRLCAYPVERPEHVLQGLRELKPVNFMDLGKKYYSKSKNGDWHRLTAVGYREKRPAPTKLPEKGDIDFFDQDIRSLFVEDN